jgi:2-haloacid dehalogenase
MSQTIVFDFGGVLIDWNPYYLYRKVFLNDDQAIKIFLEQIGFYAWNLQQDAGRPFADGVEELCRVFPQHCELIRMYDTRYEETISGPLWPSVRILEALSAQGYPLYGLSNWSVEKFELVRPKYDFFGLFREIIISGAVGLIKPDARIFELMLDMIGLPAQQVLLIDDSQANILTARQLGFDVIHFHNAEALADELAQRGIQV